jgi:hypothetical protein
MIANRFIIKLLSAAGIFIVLGVGPRAEASDRENCLMCHRHRFIGRIDENGKHWNYNVDAQLYNKSVHRLVDCRECHTYITRIPHDPVTQLVNCANQCHIKPPFAKKKFSHQKIIKIYNQSVHAIKPQDLDELKHAKPYCKYCHLNPMYTGTSEKQVPFEQTVRRCYNCHPPVDVTQAYRHIMHRLRKRTSRSPQQIVKLCAKCHADLALMSKLNVSQKALTAVKTYNQSIHGELVHLGSDQAADCLSCHASSALHDIYKEDNPKASINEDNLVHTCRQCHQSTNRWFIQIAVHPKIHYEANRLVAGTSIAFRFILYGTLFGMLGLLLFETNRRRKDGIKLALKNGTTWRGKAAHREKKRIVKPERPAGSASLKQTLISYGIGSIFIVLSLVVLAGIIHHLTISSHGPGLLKPFWDKYVAPPQSEIMDEAQRREDMEKHRHFHIIAPEYPRWPENLRPACFICHSDFPHSKNKRIRSLMNLHTQFFVCETCHIKEKPGAVTVYRWYDPVEKNPTGPFYGTSYDPETDSLTKGKDLIARIAPFRKTAKTDKFRPAILQQDAPMARDYMKVRDKLSPEERGAIKNKFHENIKPKGQECKACHSENSILDFKQLGFADNRASNLKELSVVDMISEYKEFYIPDFFSEPTTSE